MQQLFTQIEIKISDVEIRKEGKFCYLIDLPSQLNFERDKDLIIIQVGEILDQPDSQHQEIRELGDGRFSFWKSQLYFSTKNNVSLDNFENIELFVINNKAEPILSKLFLLNFASKIPKIYEVLDKNLNTNNSFFSNFIYQPNHFIDVCNKVGIDIKNKDMFIIGIGNHPFTAMRFLAEGVNTCYINDLSEIKKIFSKQEIEELYDLIEILNAKLARSFKKIFEQRENQLIVKKLEIFDRIEFEKTDILKKFDIVFTTSVLEHVMDVKGFYAKMSSIAADGGWVYHRIDLKDHLNFFSPLEFLKYSDEEYSLINTENRLRVSDHVDLLKLNNFIVKDIEYRYIDPNRYSSNGDYLTGKLLKTHDYNEVPEVVSPEHFSNLNSRFKKYSRRELSILEVDILAQKTGKNVQDIL
jgi:hypothetical protein